jgi:hypothetical protein
MKIQSILLLTCSGMLLLAADKHPWASFKPGSYAKMKSTTAAGPTKMTTEMTQTLISVDANNAVVETETKVMGTSNKSRINVPLKADAKATATPAGKAPTPTNETITVAGKALACKCYEVETSANGMKTSTRTCTSDAVPGGAVKMVSKTSGAAKSETVMELVDFAAK